MADFDSATFQKAAAILSATSESALANVALLKQSRGLLASVLGRGNPVAKLAPLDTAALFDLLRVEQASKKTYCLIGAVTKVAENGQLGSIQLTGQNQRYVLNCEIVNANGLVLVLRKGQGNAQSLPAVANLYDSIALRSRALAEFFIYLAKVASKPDLGALIMAISGLVSTADPMNESRQTAANTDLRALVADYEHRLRNGVGDIARRAANPGRIGELAKQMCVNRLPIWTTEDDAPGAKVVNDVWFPERYATPLMAELAEQQAAALASR